ncbi:hypothetical protein BKH46_01725 [Helicobacter sp. 12S02634-8]|uniref:TonB-dependent receptor domain-containing protein n=1 Tax=Helicobacter sp. 12S02634-8 TaxID=1476199 RepID=UPI000BD3EED1|nr:TonB-dependent receptor [Helicobacter sp. 12S02634-8]PAF48054.1 hypothetical protein BKH46_01725 [Helicobacter sp. 12S02634-8]
MKKIKQYICLSSVLLCPLLVWGNDTPPQEEKTYELQKSVVSASGFAQDIKDAPASISVISEKSLQEVDYHDLAEAIFNVPGVDIGTTQGKTGGYEISIRGLSASYTLYLVDGLRQNVAGDVGTRNWGWSHALNVFMPTRLAIERIEVIRGPMSTLYGSDALGGVVNIIVKKPNMRKWDNAIEFQTTVNERSQFGNYYGVNFYTSGPIIKDKLALELRGNYTYRNASDIRFSYTDTSGVKKTAEPGFVGNPTEGNIYNIGLRLAYAMDMANYFYFDVANGYQNYDNSKEQLGNFTSSPKQYVIYRTNYVLAHLGTYDWGQTKTTLQYNNTTNLGRVVPYQRSLTDTSHENRDIKGNDMILQSQAAIPVYTSKYFADTITFGAQYWLQTFHDAPYGTNPYPWSHDSTKAGCNKDHTLVNTNYIPYANSKGINSLKNQAAIYVENESTIVDDVIVTLGARYTYDQQFGNNLSPKAYLVYNALEWLQFRGGVATGYRQPYLSETVTGAFGFGAQGGAPFLGNPDLKPETSVSYEGGVMLDFSYLSLGATYFRNDYQGKIDRKNLAFGAPNCQNPYVVGHDKTSNGCSVYVNVGKAYTQGAEVVFALKPIYGFSLNANYTYTHSEQLTNESKNKGNPVGNTPAHQVNLGVNYDLLGKADIYLQGVYKSERWRNAGKNQKEIAKVLGEYLSQWYKPYYVFNLGVNYRINKNFRVSLGIQNILNTNFIDYYAYGKKGDSDNLVNLWNSSYEGRKYFITLGARF